MPAGGQCGKPVAQVRQIEGGQGRTDGFVVTLADTEKVQEIIDVDKVGAHGVLGQIPLQRQVPPIGGKEVGACPRHHRSPPDNG